MVYVNKCNLYYWLIYVISGRLSEEIVASNCLDFLDVNCSDLLSEERSSYNSVFIEKISKGMNGVSVPLKWDLVYMLTQNVCWERGNRSP